MSGHCRDSSPWFSCANRSTEAKIRLFCFPYAGGNSATYHAWPKHLSEAVEVCAVNLPGRGARLAEVPFTHLVPLVDELAAAIVPRLDRPFAFFGHSLGGLLAFELAHALQTGQGAMPQYLFVSGCGTPRREVPQRTLHDLPEDELLVEIERLGGTPQEVLGNRELMALLLPTLRADFSLWETYRCQRSVPLACPIVAFGGFNDPGAGHEQLEPWREETTGRFSLHWLPGDHFFVHSQRLALLAMIARYLDPLVRRPSGWASQYPVFGAYEPAPSRLYGPDGYRTPGK